MDDNPLEMRPNPVRPGQDHRLVGRAGAVTWAAAIGALLLISCSEGVCQDTKVPTRILILNSYHQGYEWTDDLVAAATEILSANLDPLELRIEYMDTKRISTDEHLDLLNETLRIKYADIPPDLIISSDDHAFQFLLRHGEELFGETPVVFCGMSDFEDSMIAGRDEFTGVLEALDVTPTIEVALRLHPQTKRVFVLSDGTRTGIGERKVVAAVAQEYPQLDFEYLNMEEMSVPDLCTKLRELPNDSIVLAMILLRDGNNAYIPYQETYPQIASASNVPLYSPVGLWLGRGIVGGKLNSGRFQGQQAAERALRILVDGQKPRDIPVRRDSPNWFMFDFLQMARFGIAESDLPDESIVMNRPYSLYAKHWGLIWSGTAAILFLSVVVAVLSVNIALRKRAVSALRESESRYRYLFDQSPISLWEEDFTAVGKWLEGLRAKGVADLRSYLESHPDEIRHAISLLRVRDVNDATLAMFEADSKDEILSGLPEILKYDSNLHPTVEALVALWEGRERLEIDVDATTLKMNPVTYHLRWAAPPDSGRLGLARAVLAVTDVTERKRAEEALRESEQNLAITLDSIGDAVVATDREGKVTRMNRIAEALIGWTLAEARGVPLDEVCRVLDVESREPLASPAGRILEGGWTAGLASEAILVARDGTERQIANSGAPIRDANGAVLGVVLVLRDTTDERVMQEQLRQAQKMEAVGQLAGGIAHDFNNILGGIMGFADLLTESLLEAPGSDELASYAEAIREASQRAAALTSQLLAFSRRGRMEATHVDVHDLIREVINLLRHTIDPRIEIRQKLEASPAVLAGDPAQLQNTILNLAVNARDAMPNGGTLTFSTSVEHLDEEYCLHQSFDIVPGCYLVLGVADTGIGMARETVERIFEPFFTTKGVGKGTGLGLAAVYGTVTSHRGAIDVTSEPGQGTVFKVHLPLSADKVEPVPRRGESGVVPGRGLVLLADDEAIIRRMAKRMLDRLGYEVIVAENGADAVELYRRHWREIDLVMLDMIMPKMNGREALDRVREINPDARILVASGFSVDLEGLDASARRVHVIQKPFTMAQLSRMIADAVGRE